jgi:hypothetical protein
MNHSVSGADSSLMHKSASNIKSILVIWMILYILREKVGMIVCILLHRNLLRHLLQQIRNQL